MENTKTPQTTMPNEPMAISLDPQKLLDTLYKVWDAFGRSSMPYFLIGKTYHDAKLGHELKGDKIELGVRRNEWNSGNKRLLDSLITADSETTDVARYTLDGVPVEVHIYADSDCI